MFFEEDSVPGNFKDGAQEDTHTEMREQNLALG